MKLDIPEVVTNWIAKVRQTNDVFEKASPAQKRVMIAQDVLNAIESGRILPNAGGYCTRFICDSNEERAEHNGIVWAEAVNYRLSTERAAMPLFGDDCKVCAKGALFVARLDRLDDTLLRDMVYGDPSRHLRDLFSQLQLDLIECAFEGNKSMMKWCYADYDALGGESESITEEQYVALRSEAIQYCNDTFGPPAGVHARLRLRKIMTNIVENGGTFDPTKDVKAVFHETVDERAQTTGADGKA